MNPEKLAKLQQKVRIGGKGTPRRKVMKIHKSAGGDDKKLNAVLKKLNVQPIVGVEEVNMFKGDGTVLHFSIAKVNASVASNTFVIYGQGTSMTISQVISENPSILAQLGVGQEDGKAAPPRKKVVAPAPEEDDDVPELVDTETFEDQE